MDLIYADASNIEKGVLRNYVLDLDIGKTNDFQLSVSTDNSILSYGYRFYAEDTEYGGIIDSIKVDTEYKRIQYTGRSWRGILGYKIIKPPSGSAYKTVSGDANTIIASLISELGLSALFLASLTPSGINISSYSFDRYTDLLTGLNKMLKTVNARLKLSYSNSKVNIAAEAITDYSSTEEYSEDGKIDFVIEDNRLNVNHLVCLGSGELTSRQVIDLYLQQNGTIGNTQYYTAENEIVAVFDYSNAESSDELRNKGIERLKELQGASTFQINVEDMDLDLGDIVGCRERITGLYLAKEITNKIINIKNDILTIDYKVGE